MYIKIEYHRSLIRSCTNVTYNNLCGNLNDILTHGEQSGHRSKSQGVSSLEEQMMCVHTDIPYNTKAVSAYIYTHISLHERKGHLDIFSLKIHKVIDFRERYFTDAGAL